MVAGGTIFEGDATVITASFLAHRGYLNLAWVCVLAGLVTTLQNIVLYEVARRRGGSLAEGTDRTSQRIRAVMGWVRTRGALLLFASRFLLGVRTAVALACGISQLPRARFYWTNLAGAAAWTAAMAFAGYSGGHLFTLLVDDVKRHEWTVAAGLAVVVTIGVLWKTRAAEIADLVGTAGIIEGWAKSELSKHKNNTSQ